MEVKNTVRLYNTLSREVEDLIPVSDSKIGIYACGPTVYDYTHIGHIRKYVMDDVLVRLLRYLAYQVTHVMNITDVGHLVSDDDTGEDKLEKGARREGKTAWEIAKFYEEYFFKAMEAVDVKRPDIVCRATEHIADQIALIKKLEAKGFTYTIADGVYFDSTKFPNYGKLGHTDAQGQQAGARVEMVPGKKNVTDFALWKFSPEDKKRDMEWDSPWSPPGRDKSKGFPGWHIECSAMSMRYLGESFDIHTGGIDHIPIHHTNEIAQSEAATGKTFVKYWVHHNFLFVDGQKMSKSLGNFVTIEQVREKGFDPLALRYLFLQTHYRQESNFTWEALTAAQTALTQLHNQVSVIKRQMGQGERNTLSDEKLDRVNLLRKKFKDVIRMDLNTPQALGVMWEIVKSNLPPSDKYDLLLIANDILGLGLRHITGEESQHAEVPTEIQALVNNREQLRKAGNFGEADMVRQQIEALGYAIEDSPQGTQVKKNSQKE
jgi:cysteinyl-tRNA synthetase